MTVGKFVAAWYPLPPDPETAGARITDEPLTSGVIATNEGSIPFEQELVHFESQQGDIDGDGRRDLVVYHLDQLTGRPGRFAVIADRPDGPKELEVEYWPASRVRWSRMDGRIVLEAVAVNEEDQREVKKLFVWNGTELESVSF